ncbi:MAG: hypothetical protein ACU843_09960 [Gammaproteobacteria bacterium]
MNIRFDSGTGDQHPAPLDPEDHWQQTGLRADPNTAVVYREALQPGSEVQ